ncbi:MAG: hypothetical protein NUV85_02570 [Candidatus Berkelbacteria bacterium]|nr:hypothetical protein [Candidatus Berkelbacteria bacterium]
MNKLLITFVVLAVAIVATAQQIPENSPPVQGGTVDQLDGQQGQIDNIADEAKVATTSSSSASASSAVTVSAPAWETREGIERAARHYFESKQEYNTCRGRSDNAGMRRAEASMARFSRQLAEFKKQQATRDKAQDKRLDKHSELVWKHESQLNGKEDGLVPRVKKLEEDMKAATPAIAGINGKFDGLTWSVLVLTLVVLVGFSRRYWIHR